MPRKTGSPIKAFGDYKHFARASPENDFILILNILFIPVK
jgi:hypothetical protein